MKTCDCVSSWKLPRTYRGQDGKRHCERCDGLRMRREAQRMTEDVADVAAWELGQPED